MQKNEPDYGWEDVKLVYLFVKNYLELKYVSFMFSLSTYYPFSILLRKHHYHYTYKNIFISIKQLMTVKLQTKIQLEVLEIDDDQYFVYIDFTLLTKDRRKRKNFFNYLQKNVGENNYYLSEFKNNLYCIKFIKEKIPQDMI